MLKNVVTIAEKLQKSEFATLKIGYILPVCITQNIVNRSHFKAARKILWKS